MTDTTIRVSKETRKALKVYAAKHDVTQGQAIQELLREVDESDG